MAFFTIVSYITDALLAVTAAWLLLRGHFAATKELALVPLLTALMDVAFAGQLSPELTPVISGLLFALQAAILLLSVALAVRDRALARRKAERRRRRMAIARERDLFDSRLAAQEQAKSADARRAGEAQRGVCA